MPSARAVRIEATPKAKARFAELAAKPFDELAQLLAADTTLLGGYPKPVALTTYRDTLADGTLKVVVQLAVSGWLGTTSFWVDGFSLKRGGIPVKLTPEQLYDFH